MFLDADNNLNNIPLNSYDDPVDIYLKSKTDIAKARFVLVSKKASN
jgi:hypothetical protein